MEIYHADRAVAMSGRQKGRKMTEEKTSKTTGDALYDDPKFRPFTDDFIFMNVMRSPEICRGILELLLPEEDFGEIRIMQTDNPLIDEHGTESETHGDNSSFTVETQKTLKFGEKAHGVRFDAFIKSENTWAEIEMQTVKHLALGKRARYYQSNMDMDCFEQGNDFNKLKKTYIIFICTFDYFGKDEPVHFFRTWDVEKNLPMDDFCFKIVLNTKCSPDKVPEALKPLYAYLNDPSRSRASALTQKIDDRVRKFNSDDWRRKYMTFEYMLNERKREGFAEGEAVGLEKGAAQEKREIAKNLKESGIPVDVIAKNTGLTAEEVEAL